MLIFQIDEDTGYRVGYHVQGKDRRKGTFHDPDLSMKVLTDSRFLYLSSHKTAWYTDQFEGKDEVSFTVYLVLFSIDNFCTIVKDGNGTFYETKKTYLALCDSLSKNYPSIDAVMLNHTGGFSEICLFRPKTSVKLITKIKV